MDQERVISFYKELGFSTLLDKLDVSESVPIEQEKIEVHTA